MDRHKRIDELTERNEALETFVQHVFEAADVDARDVEAVDMTLEALQIEAARLGARQEDLDKAPVTSTEVDYETFIEDPGAVCVDHQWLIPKNRFGLSETNPKYYWEDRLNSLLDEGYEPGETVQVDGEPVLKLKRTQPCPGD